MLSRRKFLYTGAVAAAGVAAVGADGFLQSNYLQLARLEVPLVQLPEGFDGFTIAQLSDFHYEDHFSVVPIRKAVELVNGLHPDLIVLTGDFVTVPVLENRSSRRQSAKSAGPCAAMLQHLQAPLGKFAVLGNHDVAADSSQIVSALHGHGIPVLLNRSVPLDRSDVG